MLDDVRPEDRISIIGFSDRAEILVEGVGGDSIDELQDAIDRIHADGQTNIYDGLRTGYDLVAANTEEGRQTRVVLLSDGEATIGITNTSKIVAMSAAYNDVGHSLTTIGVGTDFDPVLARAVGERWRVVLLPRGSGRGARGVRTGDHDLLGAAGPRPRGPVLAGGHATHDRDTTARADHGLPALSRG
jgi:hypothetical protein